jgi:hypothetical protein
VSGNPGTPSEIVSSPASPDARATGTPRATDALRSRLRAYWATPAGKAIAAATLLALVIRLFTLTRPGFLTSVNEYDDGVYLGASIRLLQGVLPYKDYAFVQPPGIILVGIPAALIAHLTTSAAGMAMARVATALVSTACVPLAGNLVRYRGALVTAVTCGVLAIYPADITTAHTFLLEPWMNLLCLLGANAAFRRGHLTRPGRMAWAGVALGTAGTIKYWAAAPAAVLLAFCLLSGTERGRRTVAYAGGLAAGFVIPVLPFVIGAPVTFLRSTILYQATRTGTTVPVSMKLAHLTGLIDFLSRKTGGLSLLSGASSLFASDSTANTPHSNAGWLPYAFAAVIIAVIAVAYAWKPKRPSPLEWFALITACLSSLALLFYSAFFYHYPAWAGPWIAITVGCAAGVLAGNHRYQRGLVYTAGGIIAAIALFQMYEIGGASVGTTTPISAHIPPGACVVADEVSMTISSDRFTAASPGCPDVIDSLATTLVLSHGVSIQGGALNMPTVVKGWKSILNRAQYVWVSNNSDRRIPWGQKRHVTPLWAWFTEHFTPVTAYDHSLGQLWERTPAG